MRSRAVLDTLMALTMVVWLNVVGGLLVPQFAEAVRSNEWCSAALSTCTPLPTGVDPVAPLAKPGGVPRTVSFPA